MNKNDDSKKGMDRRDFLKKGALAIGTGAAVTSGVLGVGAKMAEASDIGIRIQEDLVPIRDEAKGACEILGIDPLYVANEGKLIAIVPGNKAKEILSAMQKNELGKDSAIIGEVVDDHQGTVTIVTPLGVERILNMPVGEQLPRIC